MGCRVTCGVERRLLHLDLLVQPAELVVPLDQLGAEHVALGQHSLVLLLLLQPLGVGLVDDHVQREDLRLESRLLGLALADSLLDVGELIPQHLGRGSVGCEVWGLGRDPIARSLSTSFSLSTFMCSKCSLTRLWSFAWISSFSCSICRAS